MIRSIKRKINKNADFIQKKSTNILNVLKYDERGDLFLGHDSRVEEDELFVIFASEFKFKK